MCIVLSFLKDSEGQFLLHSHWSMTLASATADCSASGFPLFISTKGFAMSYNDLDILINDI